MNDCEDCEFKSNCMIVKSGLVFEKGKCDAKKDLNSLIYGKS